jgi:hypothetical protein
VAPTPKTQPVRLVAFNGREILMIAPPGSYYNVFSPLS